MFEAQVARASDERREVKDALRVEHEEAESRRHPRPTAEPWRGDPHR